MIMERVAKKLLESKDIKGISLFILPSMKYGLKSFYENAKEIAGIPKSWRVKIMMAEAAMLNGDENYFKELMENCLNSFRSNRYRNYSSLSFFIPYLIAKEDPNGYELFNEILKIFDAGIGADKIDIIDLNDFFEIFFRYLLLFRIENSDIVEKIYQLYSKYEITDDFLDILASYFKHALLIPPPQKIVNYVYETIYSGIKSMKIEHYRFVGTFLLALSIHDKDQAITNYEKLIQPIRDPINPLMLYNTAKKLSVKISLLYLLTNNEVFQKYEKDIQESILNIREIIKHLKWKIRDWESGYSVSIDDFNEFLTDFEEIAEEELIGKEELKEDLSYYLDTITNFVCNCVEGLVTVYMNYTIAHNKEIPRDSIDNLLKLLKENKIFDSSFRATILSSIALLDNKDFNTLFDQVIKNCQAFCKRENKFYCNDLVEVLGERLGQIYYLTEKKDVIDYLIEKMNEATYLKNNKFWLRGFVSGLYSLVVLKDFSSQFDST